MKYDNNKLVTVAIPNYNNKELLDNLIKSIKKSISLSNVIIVDNASQDGSATFIKQKYPEIQLIENDINTGFAHAVNQAIKQVKTDYVFLLNNDTLIEENTIQELLKTINIEENIFSVSSKMIQMSDKKLIDDAGDEYTVLGWSKRRGYGKNITNYTLDEEVFSACAGAALYKTELFDEIGYFDEKFESYVEDMDLSYRARLYGYKSYYSSKAIVYHVGSATTGSRYNGFKVQKSARNNIFMIYKNMPLWMKIFNGLFIITGVIIKFIFFYKKNLGKEYYEGIIEGIRGRKSLEKTESSFRNNLKIEYLLIKNTLTFLK